MKGMPLLFKGTTLTFHEPALSHVAIPLVRESGYSSLDEGGLCAAKT